MLPAYDARAARKFKATTNSRHSLPVAPNLLEQDFTVMAPNQKWVGDITYLATREGWLYLAVLIDLFSRKVIGWAMSERNDHRPGRRRVPDGAVAPSGDPLRRTTDCRRGPFEQSRHFPDAQALLEADLDRSSSFNAKFRI
ncbi:hypothetical protein HCU01_42170 [Halomonas cupida]|uniref:Integrase catalytic domain-containing protein n=1 Tax=Halomonas cupida TaxID=44933 RepID=A0ABQ0WLK4_9GAMM|nr:hypothetical protein HCU01_42170 [Halomonas cupida]